MKQAAQDLKERQAVEDAEDEGQGILPPDIATADADFWTCTGHVFTRHHKTPRNKLFVPTAENCPMPLKWLDVER